MKQLNPYMNQLNPVITKEQAQEHIVKKFNLTYTPELYYTSFTKLYGSTSGPMGGAGGQAITDFILEAWYSFNLYEGEFAVVFYGDKILAITDRFNVQGIWYNGKEWQ